MDGSTFITAVTQGRFVVKHVKERPKAQQKAHGTGLNRPREESITGAVRT